jgi:hypothetical protein
MWKRHRVEFVDLHVEQKPMTTDTSCKAQIMNNWNVI